jgi:O-antigen ligase
MAPHRLWIRLRSVASMLSSVDGASSLRLRTSSARRTDGTRSPRRADSAGGRPDGAWIGPMKKVLFAVGVGLIAGIVIRVGGAPYLAAGLLCVIVVMVTMDRPEWAVGTMILALPLVGRIAVFSAPGLPDVTVGRVLIVWLLFVVVRALRRQETASDPVALGESGTYLIRKVLPLWIAVFVGLMLFAAVRSPSLTGGLQGWLDEFLLPFALFLVFSRLRWSRQQCDRVIGVYLGASCMWSLLALAEFVTRRSLFVSGGVLPWASNGAPFGRTGGPFINPAFLGTALGIALVLAWVWSRGHGRLRLLALTSIPLVAVGLGTTLTRASWLGAAAGMLVVLALTLRSRLTGAVILLGAVAVGVVLLASLLGAGFLEARTTAKGPVFNRIAVQGAALRIIADNPLIGVGSDRFELLAPSNLHDVGGVSAAFGLGVAVPHNSILDATVDGGLGAGATLIVVFGLLMAAARARLRSQSSAYLGSAALAVVVVLAVNAMFVDMSLGAVISTLALSVIAVLLSTPVEQAAGD